MGSAVKWMGKGGMDMILHEEVREEVLEEQRVSSCRHHWMIETANGPTSTGICRNCREIKEFTNSLSEIERDFHDLQPAGRIDQ